MEKSMGGGEGKAKNTYFVNAVFWGGVIGVFFSIIGLFFGDKVIALMGGDKVMIKEGGGYFIPASK